MTTEYRTWVKNSWLGEYGQLDIITEPTGYIAPVLRGVWATAPYFHNGAVPTLYDVLHSAERPSVWKATEDRDYDFVKIGLKLESTSQSLFDTTDANAKRRIFDTSQIGKSKEGHTFPEKLSEEQKDQVLEYLKTL